MAKQHKSTSRAGDVVFLTAAVLCPIITAAAAITIGASWRGSRATAPILNAIRSWMIFACSLLASIVFLLLRLQPRGGDHSEILRDDKENDDD